MKLKHVITTLGLAAVMAFGVGAGLKASHREVAEAATGWKTFFVYVPGNVTDYYNSGNSYNWLEHAYDAIEAHVYKDGGSSISDWPGTLLNRLTENVVGLGFTDNIDVDSMILSNCYNDNTDVRTRSTWDGATPITFDISTYNTFTISKYNCPTGADSGSFDRNYGWSLDVQSGSDSDVNLTYNGTAQFQNTTVTLTKGTTFTIHDTLGTAITTGELGSGSAFSKGYVEWDSTENVFKVNVTGTYEVYAKPSVSEVNSAAEFDGVVWMQVDSASEAAAWAEDFVKNVGCTNAYNSKPANWDLYAETDSEAADTSKSWALNLTNGAKYLFTSATAKNDEQGGTWIEQAAFIHDMCVAKYAGCSTFMAYNDGTDHSRTAANLTMTFSTLNNNTITLVIMASALVALATAGFFFIRRRKEER